MNREIKFRVWDKKEKKLSFVSEIYWSSAEICTLDGELLPWDENLVLMQYTGLKDKNRKEIYEGDIAEHREPPASLSKDVKREPVKIWQASWVPLSYWALHDTEVVGNIYQNPELLKQ